MKHPSPVINNVFKSPQNLKTFLSIVPVAFVFWKSHSADFCTLLNLALVRSARITARQAFRAATVARSHLPILASFVSMAAVASPSGVSAQEVSMPPPAGNPGSTWSDWFFPYSAEKSAHAEAAMLRNHGVTTPYVARLQGGLHTLHFDAPFEGMCLLCG